MRDVTEFLAGIELNREMGPVNAAVTYQDSCHLAHGQRIRARAAQAAGRDSRPDIPRDAAAPISAAAAPAFTTWSQNEMAMQILARKMESVNATGAEIVATANPGCMLQLQAGVRLHGGGQRVMHVVEFWIEAYGKR